MPAAALTFDVLKQQDDVTSAAVIALLHADPAFADLSKNEGAALVKRDDEDGEKLAEGVQVGIKKGLLNPNIEVPAPKQIDVSGLSAEDVAQAIVQSLPSKEGNLIIIQGLSGTGKGTTVSKLRTMLPKCVTWSNGNVFRTYTYLTMEELKKQSGAGAAEKVSITTEKLTPSLLASFKDRLTFEQFDDVFDVVIDKTIRVSSIQNTTLKASEVSSAVPTVAQETQGEVIVFGAAAVAQLTAAGYNVVMEGRSQTLDYIPSPLRFELVIPNLAALGERRAAQRVMAAALNKLDNGSASVSQAEVEDAVRTAVRTLQ